jgi:hypothetical protein
MKIHLIQSALNQNTGTELWACPGGCSQGGTVRPRREEASRRGLAGGRYRLGRETSSRPTGEVRSPAPAAGLPAAITLAVSGRPRGKVLAALMPGTRMPHLTGELPRRLWPQAKVRPGYKWIRKARPTRRPGEQRLTGPLPRELSSATVGPPLRRAQRQNLDQFANRPARGTVSPQAKATTWPAGTSFRPARVSLRNIPQSARRPNEPSRSVGDSHVLVCP